MNLYFWLILFSYIIFLSYGALRGFRRGFVKELEGLAASVFSVLTLVLVSRLAMGGLGERASAKALAIALLIVLGAIYALCRMIFASLRLFAGLPVIRFLDRILGFAAGGAKAFLFLYTADHLLKIWLGI